MIYDFNYFYENYERGMNYLSNMDSAGTRYYAVNIYFPTEHVDFDFAFERYATYHLRSSLTTNKFEQHLKHYFGDTEDYLITIISRNGWRFDILVEPIEDNKKVMKGEN